MIAGSNAANPKNDLVFFMLHTPFAVYSRRQIVCLNRRAAVVNSGCKDTYRYWYRKNEEKNVNLSC
jgi:hypothetical protein